MKIELKRSYDEGIRNDKLVDDAFMGFEINLIPENEEEINWFRSKSAHIENFYNKDGGYTILYNEEESEIDEPKPPKKDYIIVWTEFSSSYYSIDTLEECNIQKKECEKHKQCQDIRIFPIGDEIGK
jgi:hypothetical protein